MSQPTPPGLQRRTPSGDLGLVLIGLGSFILMGAGQSAYGPALPVLARDFGLSISVAGWLISAHWIGSALAVGAMSALGATVPPRLVLAGMALGAGLIAVGPGWIGTLLGAALFGAGYGGATAVFNPLMLNRFGARGPAMLSLLNAAFAVGAIAAPLAFVALGSDPQLTYGAIALLCALGLPFAGVARQGPAAGVSPEAGPFRPDWGVLALGGAGIGMEASLIGLGPAALVATGVSETAAAGALSAFFTAFLLARGGLVFAAHLVVPQTLFAATTALGGLAGLLAATGQPVPFFVLMGATTGLIFPGFFMTANAAMQGHPRAAATIIAAGLGGGIAAPLMLAPLLPVLGGAGVLAAIGLILLTLAAGIGLRILRQRPVAG